MGGGPEWRHLRKCSRDDARMSETNNLLAGGSSQPKVGPKYIFSFGDSYTSTNFDINGEQPSSKKPFGNYDIGNHQTSAQGPVWIQLLATKHLDSRPVPTYNFAVGGASIPDNYTYQVEKQYQPKYSENKFWHESNTLFTSWIGINDVSEAWWKKNTPLILDRLDMYTKLLEQLWDTGARNFFIVNIPPLERSPYIQDGDETSIAHYASVIKVFNDNLPKHVAAFQDKHPNGMVMMYDAHKFFTRILDNPKEYGFKDNSSEGEEGCMWADGFHIRTGFDDLIAKDMAKAIADFPFIV
ncbi:uncharacterized protein RAG0_08548 [Rhynchosporium agropyri]|uniref:Cellulose-binding GDSL lipase/acylhydrolase n=1 Tax=Rhynchosporium agropyri TaxID=914238 RepID=A0A1E1KRA3_9HELO|nr:uncharacterized protein RAG0_08548 [Rhynchosporium agropyri]